MSELKNDSILFMQGFDVVSFLIAERRTTFGDFDRDCSLKYLAPFDDAKPQSEAHNAETLTFHSVPRSFSS